MKCKLTIDDINRRLDKLHLSIVNSYIDSRTKITLKCHCGKFFKARPDHVFRCKITSCGCHRLNIESKRQELQWIGRKIGRLKIISILPKIQQNRQYLCECDCGKIIPVFSSNLRRHIKPTESCGCKLKEHTRKLAQKYNSIYSGKNSPRYNHLLTDEDRVDRRKLIEFYNWRKQVYIRDNYICVVCYRYSCTLNAHHLDGWHWCKERRFDIDNGVTLCKQCHDDFHKKYGRKNNTKTQFIEYLLEKQNVQTSS